MPNRKISGTSYAEKKAFFDGLLTVYGRKPVLEALNLSGVKPFRLHLADTNRVAGTLAEILALAELKDIEIKYHDRIALSRISKNRRQDQGVALDIEAPKYQSLSNLRLENSGDLIALENITNPGNVGMIIRSVGASPCSGIILPRQGCAKIDAMVIKASAGTALKVPVYYCEQAYEGMKTLRDKGFRLMGLSSEGKHNLAQIDYSQATVFVLGNETTGLSSRMLALCDIQVRIPLNNQVESLNVSAVAGIVAFRSIFREPPD